ncbi:MAG: hypothetical protein GXO45_06130 [Aquificae bacterium]|nr:hypothetical protein [Aquificota bacterium]
MSFFKDILTIVNSLDRREKILLTALVYTAVVLAGLQITLTLKGKVDKLDKRIATETERYTYLVEVAKRYKHLKRNTGETKPLTLGEIERLLQAGGVKGNVVSVKPLQEGKVEVILKDLDGNQVYRLIDTLHKSKVVITGITIEETDRNNYKVRAVITR